jgi:hypothetical protein
MEQNRNLTNVKTHIPAFILGVFAETIPTLLQIFLRRKKRWLIKLS